MRLIDADAFERAVMFSDDEDLQDVIYRLRDFPTIEPERKKGQWMRTDAYPHRRYCSVCFATFIRNDEFLKLDDIQHKYCPNCGAYMGGEQDGKG